MSNASGAPMQSNLHKDTKTNVQLYSQQRELESNENRKLFECTTFIHSEVH